MMFVFKFTFLSPDELAFSNGHKNFLVMPCELRVRCLLTSFNKVLHFFFFLKFVRKLYTLGQKGDWGQKCIYSSHD